MKRYRHSNTRRAQSSCTMMQVDYKRPSRHNWLDAYARLIQNAPFDFAGRRIRAACWWRIRRRRGRRTTACRTTTSFASRRAATFTTLIRSWHRRRRRPRSPPSSSGDIYISRRHLRPSSAHHLLSARLTADSSLIYFNQWSTLAQ